MQENTTTAADRPARTAGGGTSTDGLWLRAGGTAERAMPPARELIFRLIHQHRQTTRTDLARLTGLGKATVSDAIADLTSAQLIRQVGKRASSGRGRNRVILEIDPAGRHVYGAQFTGREVVVLLTDLYARPLASAVTAISGLPTPEELTAAVAAGIRKIGAPTDEVLGLGVGIPGVVDAAGEVVTRWTPGGWHNVPIRNMFEQAVDLPVKVANRGKVAALGELWHGNAQGSSHLVYVYLGSGLGAGVVIGGQLYGGRSGVAAELGHVTVVDKGPRCECGNHGCLHLYASESALVSRYARLSKQTLGPVEDLERALAEGDPVAKRVVVDAARITGTAVANVANLFDPELVLFGGSTIERFGALFLDRARAEIEDRAHPDVVRGLRIEPASLGNDAGAIGAAALMLAETALLAPLYPV